MSILNGKMTKSYLKNGAKLKRDIPIVDAAMRQINEIGYMHNRNDCWLIFNKRSHIDWQWGEQFARHLVDYDPCC